MCSNLKTEFCEYSNITVFKREESDKASVDSTHTQGACGGDSIDLPIVNVPHSPTIDVEYVFVSSNTVTISKIVSMNDYLKLNLSFLHDGKSISKLKFFFCNFN